MLPVEHLDYPAEQVVGRPVADCLGLVQHPVAVFRVDYPLVVLGAADLACSRAV